MSHTERGSRWVIVQIILLAIVGFSPGQYVENPLGTILSVTGLTLFIVGAGIGLIAVRGLGRNLSVFPKPLDDAQLVDSGIYGIVRHPIYSGVILVALGWALFRASLIAGIVALGLIIFFDRKAALEERWLTEKFPNYPEYRQRTKKLIPFIY
jgi:protein-S-isoprenylcysteine O-methyltransferase Ste14